MSFVPPVELEKSTLPKYLMVVLAAKETRRLNLLPKEFRKEYENDKITTVALNRLAADRVKHELRKRKNKK